MVFGDGGPATLVACGVVREAAALAGVQEPPAMMPFGDLSKPRLAACRGMAERLGLVVVEPPPPARISGAGERESIELLRSAYAAARAGFDECLWPASAAVGDALDLDRIAECADRAVLVSRLVALDGDGARGGQGGGQGGGHGRPGITIRCPYVDLTDRQIAELIVDMDLPAETVWWWGGSDEAARAERERWMPALERAGVRAG